MDNLIKISSLEEYENATKGKSIFVFSTLWCPDCHFLKTFIDEIVESNTQWTFYYIDRDELIDLCIDLQILGIPSFVAYENGQEVGRFVSKLRKTKDEIQKFINELE